MRLQKLSAESLERHMLDAVHMKAENSPPTFSLAVLQVVRRALKGSFGDEPPGGTMPMAQCQRKNSHGTAKIPSTRVKNLR